LERQQEGKGTTREKGGETGKVYLPEKRNPGVYGSIGREIRGGGE